MFLFLYYEVFEKTLIAGHNIIYSKDEVFSVGVVELTIPWDGRVDAARAEKRQAYSPLVEALSGNPFGTIVYMYLYQIKSSNNLVLIDIFRDYHT